ncbi:MAG: YceI family protein [Aureispira sp.]|nr:YceI family protein [Aureispira sp.]
MKRHILTIHTTTILVIGLLLSSANLLLAQMDEPNFERPKEELIIFIQQSKESPFTIKEILRVDSFINSIGIPAKVIDIERQGAPKEVCYTPYIIYQNYLGRKVYKGRYTTLNRLKNFISTVRLIPSDAGEYPVANALVWEEGRSQFFVQTKITPLKGTFPDNFNPILFMNEVWAGLKKGMDGFNFHTRKDFLLSNEIFYLNYYPYATNNGKLMVTYEMYSHYDCINPIYKQFELPKEGSFDNIRKVFADAAKDMRKELLRQWKESELGDAVSAINEEIKMVSWEDLGFTIPPPPTKQERSKIIKDLKLASKWVYAPIEGKEMPDLQFYFPPPLHQYSGSVGEITGGLEFANPDSLLISGLQGSFEVNTSSVTMGLEDLDIEVHNKMLKVKNYPTASLHFLKVRAKKGATIELGKPTYTQVEAEFKLMFKTVTIKAPTQLEPFVDDDGQIFLHVKSSFDIKDLMETYSIEGPPGPSAASNNMIVKIDLFLKPVL